MFGLFTSKNRKEVKKAIINMSFNAETKILIKMINSPSKIVEDEIPKSINKVNNIKLIMREYGVKIPKILFHFEANCSMFDNKIWDYLTKQNTYAGVGGIFVSAVGRVVGTAMADPNALIKGGEDERAIRELAPNMVDMINRFEGDFRIFIGELSESL